MKVNGSRANIRLGTYHFSSEAKVEDNEIIIISMEEGFIQITKALNGKCVYQWNYRFHNTNGV